MRRGGFAALGLCGSLLAMGAVGEAKSPAVTCAENRPFYDDECRPASVCAPGCFPQAILCRERPVLRSYDLPWAKFLDQEHHAMPLYNKRLDRGGLDQEHLAYIPDLGVAIGSHISPTWNGVYWGVELLIDEGADGTLDRRYRFDMLVTRAATLFSVELPRIIVAAQQEHGPLSYLYGRLDRFAGAKTRVAIDADAVATYRDLLSELKRQMCAPGVR